MDKPYEFFSFHMKCLTLLQLWPNGGVMRPNTWKRLESYYFILIIMPNTLPLTVDMLMILTEDDVDIAMIIQSLLAWVCIFGEHYMAFCFILNRESIKRLIDNLYQFKEFTKLENMIETDKKATLYSKVLVAYSTLGSLFYAVAPLLSISKCNKMKTKSMIEYGIPCGMIARVRLPVRYDYTPFFQLMYGHQVFLVFAISWVIIILTMLLCGILMQATNHLKTLGNFIFKISEDGNMISEKDFNFCVRYHIAIIKYCDDLNKAFGSQLVIHMSLTSFIISILTFELLMVDFTDVVRFGLHLLGWLCLLLLVCFYGQTLIDESENIAVTVYYSNWHNSPLKVKKDIKQMIMRAQKPITLNALNLGFMSLATFLKVLSSAYSYLTLLINIK